MKRNRSFLRVTAVLLSALMLFVLGGCGETSGLPNAGGKLAAESLSGIGKTFDQIREENPDVEYQSVPIPDASGECLGQSGDSFFWFFFGTQAFPGLNDLSGEHGHELKCAGIISTVGEIYSGVTEEVPLEQFFSDYRISEYTYQTKEQPDQGWIEFYHDGYHVWIDTKSGGEEVTAMKPGWTVLVTDEEVARENYDIWDAYWKSHLEEELSK